MYATPIFITEMFRLFTYVQLTLTVKVMIYTVLVTRLVFITHLNSKATPTNNTDYSCYKKVVELV